MFTGSAAGKLLPPYIVYKSKKLYDTWLENGPEGAVYNQNVSGWFDAHLFEEYFFRIALSYFKKLPNEEAKVMIGDNLASHLSFKMVKTCFENNIRFAFLPPNSTHMTQPLDVAFFAPLKNEWRKILMKWKKYNRGVLPKSLFPSLLRQTITNLGPRSATNLISGFRTTGIYPLNRNCTQLIA